MSFNQKQMTKKELVEKMHNERRMWQNRVEYVRKESRDQAIAASRKIMDAVVSSIIRAFGTADGDALRLDINVPEERDGYVWQTKIEVVDDKTWRLWAKEVELPKEEETADESDQV